MRNRGRIAEGWHADIVLFDPATIGAEPAYLAYDLPAGAMRLKADATGIERVYVNFPDPWFKRKHQDRRMVDDALADQIARAARPGAEIFVQTDVWDLAIDGLTTFDGDLDDRFINQAGEWSFWKQGNPYGVRSWREENAEATGLPIWRILYHRR